MFKLIGKMLTKDNIFYFSFLFSKIVAVFIPLAAMIVSLIFFVSQENFIFLIPAFIAGFVFVISAYQNAFSILNFKR